MWRYVGVSTCALVVAGCVPDCDDAYYVYRCSLYYSPYYGYYEACYPVRYHCRDSHKCKGSKCDDDNPPAACKRDDDCEPGQHCNSEGNCTKSPSPDGGAGAPPDAGASGGAPSVDGSVESGGSAGAPGEGGSPGSGATSGGGGEPANTGGGAATGGGASTGTGGVQPGDGSGGTTASGGGTSATGGVPEGGASGTGGASTGGSSSGGERIRRFNFPCIRDTQCGAGDCVLGECFTSCEADTECGTADRCSVESGRRICMPDPNPPVRCDQSQDCSASQACVNGACHDRCDVDTDCVDAQDRCVQGFCFPDRRPIAECVLNVECPSGLVCLDARCVDLANP